MSGKKQYIPVFYLYGEPHRTIDERFVHAETLDDRTRPSEWTIRPHSHAELSHIFHVAAGGGVMRAESKMLHFAAPCLLIVPAGLIHGFTWTVESRGAVLTLGSAYLDEIGRQDADIKGMFSEAQISSLSQDESEAFGTAIGRLMRELAWAGRGHATAIRAETLGLMVATLRASAANEAKRTAAPGRRAGLVAQFRNLVEERFRNRVTVEDYAAELGVTLRQLREACHNIANQAPSRIVDQRVLLEAKRALVFSNLSIAEIADSLGFADAAYFSRFFSCNAGQSPRAFRVDAAAASAFG